MVWILLDGTTYRGSPSPHGNLSPTSVTEGTGEFPPERERRSAGGLGQCTAFDFDFRFGLGVDIEEEVVDALENDAFDQTLEHLREAAFAVVSMETWRRHGVKEADKGAKVNGEAGANNVKDGTAQHRSVARGQCSAGHVVVYSVLYGYSGRACAVLVVRWITMIVLDATGSLYFPMCLNCVWIVLGRVLGVFESFLPESFHKFMIRKADRTNGVQNDNTSHGQPERTEMYQDGMMNRELGASSSEIQRGRMWEGGGNVISAKSGKLRRLRPRAASDSYIEAQRRSTQQYD
ncbi:hypothetical protein BJ138DRAFT_1107575 [Hygrophoropsis aurantiaca]|uniref:Uncharacterized protein n=1 Tax=Hygrophoropsis aurantiaca TaxID=72124 RepID=A0ACB7ZRL6_9AGAM|nr:hypothetical protein BJ138DRAFT_1107575 [Hygrophoropsis aurantiaca]